MLYSERVHICCCTDQNEGAEIRSNVGVALGFKIGTPYTALYVVIFAAKTSVVVVVATHHHKNRILPIWHSALFANIFLSSASSLIGFRLSHCKTREIILSTYYPIYRFISSIYRVCKKCDNSHTCDGRFHFLCACVFTFKILTFSDIWTQMIFVFYCFFSLQIVRWSPSMYPIPQN